MKYSNIGQYSSISNKIQRCDSFWKLTIWNILIYNNIHSIFHWSENNHKVHK